MRHNRPDYERFQDPDGLIPEDEPVFLIRGQDTVSGDAVRAWADLYEAAGGDAQTANAVREHAAEMDAWPTKKMADRPS